MPLPYEIPQARILMTVKTYPLPSSKYDELVCTAGFLSPGQWIRIYPFPFRSLPYKDQFKKYQWITGDLVRNTKDFRPESFRFRHGAESIHLEGRLDTQNEWQERKKYALHTVFDSLSTLIQEAKGPYKTSLATLKPKEIIGFHIEQEKDREWKKAWVDQLSQGNLWERTSEGEGKIRKVIPKLPYKYSYEFLTENDQKARTIMIEDWEIGSLYWRSIHRGATEAEANAKVRQKYYDEFCTKKDLYFFVGTTKRYHYVSRQPFVIIGVFYPPLPNNSFIQGTLF